MLYGSYSICSLCKRMRQMHWYSSRSCGAPEPPPHLRQPDGPDVACRIAMRCDVKPSHFSCQWIKDVHLTDLVHGTPWLQRGKAPSVDPPRARALSAKRRQGSSCQMKRRARARVLASERVLCCVALRCVWGALRSSAASGIFTFTSMLFSGCLHPSIPSIPGSASASASGASGQISRACMRMRTYVHICMNVNIDLCT